MVGAIGLSALTKEAAPHCFTNTRRFHDYLFGKKPRKLIANTEATRKMVLHANCPTAAGGV